MPAVYATLIMKGLKTLDQVPAVLRDEVILILKENGVEVNE